MLECGERFGEAARILLPGQPGLPILLRSIALPERRKALFEIALGVRVAAPESDRFELARDVAAMPVEIPGKGLPVRVSHRDAQASAIDFVAGQVVYLLIAHRLDEILEAPQKHVGLAKPSHRGGLQPAAAFERGQHAQQTRLLQFLAIAAADELHGLHDELDLANPARPELDVVREVAPLDLGGDQRIHLAQRFEYTVVQVTAVDERHDKVLEKVGGNGGRRRLTDDPRLDIGIALPVPAVLQQVGFERRKARDRRTAVAEWPQARIDPEHEAIGCMLIQERNN